MIIAPQPNKGNQIKKINRGSNNKVCKSLVMNGFMPDVIFLIRLGNSLIFLITQINFRNGFNCPAGEEIH
jgi:hypothetical protein